MIDKIIENWRIAQNSGAVLPCPRCGMNTMHAEIAKNALSRRADIYVCALCGTYEAIEDMTKKDSPEKKLSLKDWFVCTDVFRISGYKETEKGFDLITRNVVSVTKEDIDDILCASLEGGVTSLWFRECEVCGEYLGEFAHEQISRGGNLKFYDNEDDSEYLLTPEKFLTGLRLWCTENNVAKIDTMQIDAIDADCIVQYALFGEIVYG